MPKQVWVVHCHWNKPYFVENQWDSLGLFSTEGKAQKAVRRHEEYARTDEEHAELKCEAVISPMTIDVYADPT